MRFVPLICIAFILVSDSSSPGQTGSTSALEIRQGMLVENAKPFFLYGLGMEGPKQGARSTPFRGRKQPAQPQGPRRNSSFDMIKGLNLDGLATGLSYIYENSPNAEFNKNKMAQTIQDNLRSGIITNLLWAGRFPRWALQAFPEELMGGTGWYKYNILSPRAQSMHRTALELVLDGLKPNYPFSIDLANEPSFNGNVAGTRGEWQNWLQNQYKSIADLNRTWSASYGGFSQISTPGFVGTGPSQPWESITKPFPASQLPVYRDWTVFNQHRVAKWFSWLAGIIRTRAPQIKLHVKMFPNPFFDVDRGIAPIDIVDLSDFAGCDTWTYYIGSGPWAFEWQSTWIYLDMLRSIQPRKPVFNSENHFFMMGKETESKTAFAPEAYFYATLMGEAVHGQYATYIWGRNAKGNVQDRPEAIRGIERAIADTQRLSGPVSMLSAVEPKITILFSRSTMIADFTNLPNVARDAAFYQLSPYVRIILSIYERCITSGMPVSFAYEERPLSPQISSGSVLIIPGATHLQGSTGKELVDLAQKGTPLVFYNSPLLYDEHGRPIETHNMLSQQKGLKQAKDLDELLRLTKSLVPPPDIQVKAGSGEPTGVEWRYSVQGGEVYVFLLNHSNSTKNLSIQGPKVRQVLDLIENGQVAQPIALKPLGVMMLKVTIS